MSQNLPLKLLAGLLNWLSVGLKLRLGLENGLRNGLPLGLGLGVNDLWYRLGELLTGELLLEILGLSSGLWSLNEEA